MSDHIADPAAPTDESTEVSHAVAAFLTAFAALDWETFRGCFVDNAVVFFPSIDYRYRIDGREQVELVFAQVVERARVGAAGPPYLDLLPRNLNIHHMGDHRSVTFHLTDLGILCRRTLILQRTASGWKIVHLHASNVPHSPMHDP